MVDVHDTKTRSFNMSRIRSRDTKPETALRQMLWRSGFRGYRLHSRLPGRPDIVFSRPKVVVFVDGCFWHCCPKCSDGRAPKTHTRYWGPKREGNIARDKRNTRELRKAGWIVVRLWEHEILKSPAKSLRRVESALLSRVT